MPVADKPQCLKAMARGNRIKHERAVLKREIKAARVRVADLLRDGPPDCLDSMFVESLLLTIRRMPRKVALNMMAAIPVGLTVSVGKLTKRQRLALADALDARQARQK